MIEEQNPVEGFTFGDFVSQDEGLFLMSRDAPTPDEKSVIESVPFMQGQYDFSMIMGDRVFENRTLSYVLQLRQRNFTSRKGFETYLKNKLMRNGILEIRDTYDIGYHFLGKCISVSVAEESGVGLLNVAVTFNCYPFKIADLKEGHDIWDDFNFLLDVAQQTSFYILSSTNIKLLNEGTVSVSPTIISTVPMVIEKGNSVFNIPAGTSSSELLRLEPGINDLTLEGKGIIEFIIYKELI